MPNRRFGPWEDLEVINESGGLRQVLQSCEVCEGDEMTTLYRFYETLHGVEFGYSQPHFYRCEAIEFANERFNILME